MRILYGVQGTGNGHITRARVMARTFQQRNLKVDYLFSGRPAYDYYDMEVFADYRCCPGLSLSINQGSVQYWQTLRQAEPLRFFRDRKTLNIHDYDLVITDFEPLTAWAAKRSGVPSLGLGHQYAFHYDIPKAGNNPVAAAIMRYFAPADYRLGLHWHHFNAPLLPPIIATGQELPDSAADPGAILVYLPVEAQHQVIRLLQHWPQYRFNLFTNDFPAGSYQNVRVHRQSREGFQRHLLGCAGVICNAGFELVSEALSQGKKLLVRPLARQMEQLSNAAALQQLNLAHTMTRLSAEKIEQWLHSERAVQVRYPNVAKRLTDWICNGDWSNPLALAGPLWEQTESPQYPDRFFNIEASGNYLQRFKNEFIVTSY